MKTLTLFPDTNFFFECQPPKNCPWADITDADEVRLVICRHVRSEIDHHKADRGRLGRSARIWVKLFREISKGQSSNVLREANPRVSVSIAPPVPQLENLPSELDMANPDDKMIAQILAQRRFNPDFADANFFTDDGGAADTARYVGLETIDIPLDDGNKSRWRKEREPDPLEKRLRQVEGQLRELEADKPVIEIAVHDDDGTIISEKSSPIIFFQPLALSKVAELRDQVKQLHPCAQFSEKPNGLGLNYSHMGLLNRAPPSRYDIAEYTDEKYPSWLEAAEKKLSDMHEGLTLSGCIIRGNFQVSNTGAIPADSVLVTIKVLTGGCIFHLPEGDDDPIKLWVPEPPAPPEGHDFLEIPSYLREPQLPHVSLRNQPSLKQDAFYTVQPIVKNKYNGNVRSFGIRQILKN